MLVIWLKERKEFKKVCQGKVVYFTVDGSSLRYLAPARVNEVDVLYAFESPSPIPFREHHDFEDAEGIHVQQLIEVDNVYCLSINTNIVADSGIWNAEPMEVF